MSTHILQKTVVSLIFVALAACTSPTDEEKVIQRDRPLDQLREDEKLVMVATTGMIGDALQQLCGPFARVHTLMGPGVDPHLYKPTPSDLSILEAAHFFCHNGLNLEGKMGAVIEGSWSLRRTYSITAGLNYNRLIEANDYEGTHDPHFWFDLTLWDKAVDSLAIVLSNEYYGVKDEILNNASIYRAEIQKTHGWAVKVIQSIPKEKRVLVTAHDAFSYFGRVYGMEVRSLQGISTASEFGIRDVTNLVNMLVEQKIPAIFPETSISPKALEAVIQGCRKKGWDVRLGNTLYGDALGEKGLSESTLLGAFRHNVISMYEALTNTTYNPEDYE